MASCNNLLCDHIGQDIWSGHQCYQRCLNEACQYQGLRFLLQPSHTCSPKKYLVYQYAVAGPFIGKAVISKQSCIPMVNIRTALVEAFIKAEQNQSLKYENGDVLVCRKASETLGMMTLVPFQALPTHKS